MQQAKGGFPNGEGWGLLVVCVWGGGGKGDNGIRKGVAPEGIKLASFQYLAM